MSFHVGDKVTRKSYHGDIVFVILDINEKTGLALLKGHDVRLLADAPIEDLELVGEEELAQRMRDVSILQDESLKLIRQDREVQQDLESWQMGAREREKKTFILEFLARCCTSTAMKATLQSVPRCTRS